MKTTTKPKQSKAPELAKRLAFLEEAYRHTLDALEMAASLGVPEGVKPLNTATQVLSETALRLKKLLKFKTMAFFLVREPGGELYLARSHPPGRERELEEQMRLLVESGSAAWALQRKRPVFTSAASGQGQVILHSMATASRIRGMFLGVLGQDIKTITDAALTLVTIVLRGSASLLEGIELYGLLRKANAELRLKVKDLEDSKKKLTREIVRRRKVEEQLQHQALHDPLTGLANRTLVRDRIQQAIRRGQRDASRLHAVAFMDLDKFKLVNDTLGHDAGDALLVQVGKRLLECVRAADTVARFGGDEFVIFLEDLATQGEAVRVAKRIRQALARPFELAGHPVTVTGSIGIRFGGAGRGTPESLIKHAGTAMRLAKENGRNRIKVFGEKLRGTARQYASLVARLRQDVAAGRTGVSFVPIFSLAGLHLNGFEALPAWTPAEGQAIDGGELMDLAARERMAWELWLATLKRALASVRRWRDTPVGFEDMAVSLTLGHPQLPHEGLHDAVVLALNQAGLPGRTLRLEIPEETLALGGERLTGQLTRLKDYGVRLSAGDFGERFFSFHQGHPSLLESLMVHAAKLPTVDARRTVGLLASLSALADALDLSAQALGLGTHEATHAATTPSPHDGLTPETTAAPRHADDVSSARIPAAAPAREADAARGADAADLKSLLERLRCLHREGLTLNTHLDEEQALAFLRAASACRDM